MYATILVTVLTACVAFNTVGIIYMTRHMIEMSKAMRILLAREPSITIEAVLHPNDPDEDAPTSTSKPN